MGASSINSVNSSSLSNLSVKDPTLPTKTLGQDDFLKLLVTQMTSQDPLNPQKDTDFVAQMASFTSLEQAKSTGTDIALLQANSLLGRTVTMQVNSTTATTGQVSAVQIEAGKPSVVVNGQSYDLSQLLTIVPTVNSN